MAELIEDELAFLSQQVSLAGRTVLDVGCGAGAATRRLVQQFDAERAIGLEVDEERVHQNNTALNPEGVIFAKGLAESLPFPDATFDVALMQKSFHHVPIARMDEALAQAARVLNRDIGTLVVSEPVAAGPFDEIMRTFHDEHAERAAAQDALARCRHFRSKQDLVVAGPVRFASFEQFVASMMSPEVIGREASEREVTNARAVFGRYAHGGQLDLQRDFRITILRLPLGGL